MSTLKLSSLSLSFAFVLITAAYGFGEARISGFQTLGERSGVVYTASAVYRTKDAETWETLPVPKAINETIASVNFIDASFGFVVLADQGSSAISLAFTKDGGRTWERRPIAVAGIAELELDLETARIVRETSGLRLTIRVPTSSNFRGLAVYRSTDDGATWRFSERIIEANAPAEVSAVEEKGAWKVETRGECFGYKTGCFQMTELFISGKASTPPEIKTAAEFERETARQEAESSPMFHAPGGSRRISLNRGFDKCQNSSVASMQLWWDNSYFFDANIYFSGRNRACSQTLTSSWVDQVSSMGWGLIPTVVGYQSPCTASATSAKFSYDPPTAEQQGRGEADIAAADAANIGLTVGSVLYYDMERYDETASTPGCRTATIAFLKGWTERIRELGYLSGTYGSPSNAVPDWWPMPAASRMDAIWMARWDNVMSVWTYNSPSPAFPVGAWENHQRIKQWQAPHNETWGGVTFNIDGNIADGPVAGVPVAKNQVGDFDGDRKTDIAVYRPSDGSWYIINSSNSTFRFLSFGAAGDVMVPGDYDGDGKTDQAVFRPSTGYWFILGKAGTFSAVPWGLSDDVPVPADYNGDGKTDVAVFRPSDGVWYIANSDSRKTYTFAAWGAAGDRPVVGDYDGDGKADLAVFRPSTGVWWLKRSFDDSPIGIGWGFPTDLPSPGDYDGDGKTDVAVFRDGTWWLLRSTEGILGVGWGFGSDLPIPGDYDGDGRTDVSVFRPSDGNWYLNRSQLGLGAASWGYGTDVPVPRGYIPN